MQQRRDHHIFRHWKAHFTVFAHHQRGDSQESHGGAELSANPDPRDGGDGESVRERGDGPEGQPHAHDLAAVSATPRQGTRRPHAQTQVGAQSQDGSSGGQRCYRAGSVTAGAAQDYRAESACAGYGIVDAAGDGALTD